jgi:hypothetical protein
MGLPRRHPEFREGPEAAERFMMAMRRVVSVSKEEFRKREAAGKKGGQTRKTHRKNSNR